MKNIKDIQDQMCTLQQCVQHSAAESSIEIQREIRGLAGIANGLQPISEHGITRSNTQ